MTRMARRMGTIGLLAALILFVTADLFSATAAEVTSPNGSIQVTVTLENREPTLAVQFQRQPILGPSSVGLTIDPPIDGNFEVIRAATTEASDGWNPRWGENATIYNFYRGLITTLRERGPLGRTLKWEIRVFNEGVAFRFLLPESKKGNWKIVGERTGLAFDAKAVAWPISSTEGTYPKDPVALGTIQDALFPPLTLKTPGGAVVSVLEVAGDSWPRMRLAHRGNGVIGIDLLGEATVTSEKTGETATPWRVLLIAPDEGRLVANESFLLNLAKPSEVADESWIIPGKTLSNESNCDIQTDKLKSMVDFAADLRMKYIQIDWGWYGTEWTWNDAEREKWAETNPDKADDPDWKRNTQANPFQVAKGLVPYLPTWKSATTVNLDLPELIRYGQEKGVGICLYVNDRMLKSNDLEKLFAEYEKWGLAGLKPGFVRYGNQESETAIEEMIQTAARHRLWLCVHDEYLPNGFSRTYPNLLSVEGGGGQEGNHPDWHDVTLPFARGLAGPFDYTPVLFKQGKSHAHQLSLLLTLYNPAPVFRGGWAIRENQAEEGFGNVFGSEREFLRKLETDWEETRVLDAKIGRFLIIARKTKAGVWQLGATNGPTAMKTSINLGFLSPGRKYRMTIWTDAEKDQDGWRPTVRSEAVVQSTDKIDFIIKEAGGAVAIFEPVE